MTRWPSPMATASRGAREATRSKKARAGSEASKAIAGDCEWNERGESIDGANGDSDSAPQVMSVAIPLV